MRSLRRLFALSILAVLVAVAGAVATGRLTHVATSGVSMEPTYTAGDLVVLGRSASYEIGQIVGYRVPGDDTLVLHRIIGGDESGFEIRGDNNESLDPYRPNAEEILGRELVHVPRVGGVLSSPLVRGALLFPVLALLGVITMSPTRGTTGGATTTDGRGTIARRAWKMFLVVDVVLLAGLGVVQLTAADERADTDTDIVAPTQTAELRYHADVEASDTYPDGIVNTGDPVFITLIDRVGVSFRHTADASGTITGTAALGVELSTASGWRTTRELVEPTTFDSVGARLDETLVLPQIRALVDRVAEATGVPAGTISIVVTASGEASLDGAPSQPFSVDMPLQLNPASLTLATEANDSSDGPVVAATSPLAELAQPDGGQRPIRDLRTPLLYALLAAVVATVLLWPTSDDEEAAVPAPAPVPVEAGALTVRLPSTVARIQVDGAEALRSIASAAARPVIAADGWEGVLTADALYWYETSSPATTGRSGEPSPLPSPATAHDHAMHLS